MMVIGVAFIIGLGQLDFAIGLEIKHDRSFDFIEKFYESLDHIKEIQSAVPFIFFLVNFLALFFLVKYIPSVPWNIVLCVFGVIAGYLGEELHVWPMNELVGLGQHFSGVNWSLQLFTLPSWTGTCTVPCHCYCH